jgi:hypothetical protein
VNLGFDLDDGVDQETDHVALVRAHRLVHPGNLVASVSFDSEMKKKCPSYLIQWRPLNGITLGQRQTDSNNRLILISGSALTYIRYERVIWELSSWINVMPLTDWSCYPWSH